MQIVKKKNLRNLIFFSIPACFLIVILNCATASDYSIPEGTNREKIESKGQSLQKVQKELSSIAREASPAVVFISVSKVIKVPYQFFNPFEDFFGFGFPNQQKARQKQKKFEREFKQRGAGSGFIIDLKKGYILTNNHVVGNTEEITVITSDKKKFVAKVVGTDKHSDVAVIQVKNLSKNLKQLYLADSNKIKVGDFAIAIGAPHALPGTFTFGVVSAKGRKSLNITDYGDFIQTDAAINLGNSGGPLLNISGDVMGMNTAIFSQSGGNIGLGFAIPANILRSIAQRLINKGSIERGHLGVYIQDLDENLAQEFGVKDAKGALVSQVEDGSAAAKAGIRDGDVIVKVNEEKIENSGHLKLKIAMSPPNKKVDIEIIRKGKRKSFKVKLKSREKTEKKFLAKENNKWGLTLENNSPRLRSRYQLTTSKGLVITGIESNSKAAIADIREGDVILSVNGKPVGSIRDLRKYDTRKTILLRILRRDMYRYVQMEK